MPRVGVSRVELLLAMLGSSPHDPLDGSVVVERLGEAGHAPSPSNVLLTLLELESAGHVAVERAGGYRFSLTPTGEQAAYDLGPGAPTDLVLVMVDLVGFVAFTAAEGDAAAHRAARLVHDAGEQELARSGGRMVKPLGDGFLGTLPPRADAIGALRRVAQRCTRPDGSPWPLRGAVHRGCPIVFRGDVYGADVNLIARLCDAAGPGELIVTDADGRGELLGVRGLDEPIAITRRSLP